MVETGENNIKEKENVKKGNGKNVVKTILT
jgi:hypothetical protein